MVRQRSTRAYVQGLAEKEVQYVDFVEENERAIVKANTEIVSAYVAELNSHLAKKDPDTAMKMRWEKIQEDRCRDKVKVEGPSPLGEASALARQPPAEQ